jgi:uncharacterized iron-regulated membrane protein
MGRAVSTWLRQIVFWLHLTVGSIAGIVILIMCVTGTAVSFEKELIAWAERDERRSPPPAPEATPLALEDLLGKIRAPQPGTSPSSVTVYAQKHTAVLVSYGRTNSLYVNPYTAETRSQGAPRVRAFLRVMIEWHRYLGAQGENRARGKTITGAGNVAFLGLAVSGIYLWWPRQWSRAAWRAVTLFNFSLRGKARDWNWHNTIGFWCAPVFIVLTITAMPISYRWAGDLIYKITGTEPPANPAPATPVVKALPPAPGAVLLDYHALLTAAKRELPNWDNLTLRLRPGTGARVPEDSRDHAPAVTVVAKESGTWPRTATTTLTLDPYTGSILRRETFGDLNRGRQLRTWTRFLHTGEALGWGGQLIAGVASLGGAVLVWTGLALALRRGWQRISRPQPGAPGPANPRPRP